MGMENKTPQQQEEGPGFFHSLVVVGWGLSCFVLFPTVICVVANWVDDFLHAPLGIKDNPPEPGVIVQFAQIAFWPVVIAFAVLGIWKVVLDERAKQKKRVKRK
jgi:hypothetical protein